MRGADHARSISFCLDLPGWESTEQVSLGISEQLGNGSLALDGFPNGNFVGLKRLSSIGSDAEGN